MSEEQNKCKICNYRIEEIENGHCKDYVCGCDTITYELGAYLGAENRIYLSREEALKSKGFKIN